MFLSDPFCFGIAGLAGRQLSACHAPTSSKIHKVPAPWYCQYCHSCEALRSVYDFVPDAIMINRLSSQAAAKASSMQYKFEPLALRRGACQALTSCQSPGPQPVAASQTLPIITKQLAIPTDTRKRKVFQYSQGKILRAGSEFCFAPAVSDHLCFSLASVVPH